MNKNLLAVLIAILSIVLVWVLFFWNPAGQQQSDTKHKAPLLIAAPTGGDFTVKTFDKDLTLHDLKGKVVLLYFGYTQCPDICPTSLSLMSQALSTLSDSELASVSGLFISVDPNRDTSARLKDYTQYFHSNIIGATNNKAEIDKITQRYGASYRIVKSDSAMGYIVDHSSATYVIDQQGNLRQTLVHGTSPDIIRSVIRKLLAEKQQ
jgi:protein SCO1/2